MRDSGLDITYALREDAIKDQRQSYKNASSNNFKVGTYEEFIPSADLVINLTPDKQHTSVIKKIVPLIKKGAALSYSHGFNIVEEGMKIREDITVIMVAPKCPGSEVREEYKRGFGVPTLIAVHPENDPEGKGYDWAKAYAFATGGHRAGVLDSSFVAEVKSDLMGEQTILCGVLQTGSILSFDKMVAEGVEPAYAAKLIQYGWETITEALKHDQKEALKNADFVYVKNWSSYENYGEALKTDRDWTFNQEKLRVTNNAKVMHCLPVRRNVVIADDVLDSENSVVIHQANNRTFAAQAVLKKLLQG